VIYLRKGDSRQAAGFFRASIKSDCANVTAHSNLAKVLKEDGRIDEAIVQLQKALKWDRHSFRINYYLGQFYLEKGAADIAVGYLNEASRINPHDPNLNFQLGLSHQLRGDRQAALNYFREAMALERDPKKKEEVGRRLKALQTGKQEDNPIFHKGKEKPS
jgi:tetratricopeptide (TPR) repeat protein